MSAVYKREFSALFRSPLGYAFLTAYFLALGFLTWTNNLVAQSASFQNNLSVLSLVLGLLLPLLTMTAFSEDRRHGTDLLLLSLPLSLSSILLGKYLAYLSLLGIAAAGTMFFPVILSLFGTLSLSASYFSIFALFLFGATLLAVCFFFSTLSRKWVLSGLYSLLAMVGFLFFFLPKLVLPSAFDPFFDTFSLFSGFELFSLGIFEVRSLVLYVSLSVLFLFFSALSLRKWRRS